MEFFSCRADGTMRDGRAPSGETVSRVGAGGPAGDGVALTRSRRRPFRTRVSFGVGKLGVLISGLSSGFETVVTAGRARGKRRVRSERDMLVVWVLCCVFVVRSRLDHALEAACSHTHTYITLAARTSSRYATMLTHTRITAQSARRAPPHPDSSRI